MLDIEKERQKALAGDEDAAYLIGRSYLYGENGIEQNYQEGFNWFEFGSKLDNKSICTFGLACCYLHGYGTEKDAGKATRLFIKSFLEIKKQHEDVDCQFILGEYYRYGLGNIESDPEEALFWYKKAAAQGFAAAQYCLAQCYESEKYQDLKMSFEYYSDAAAQGHQLAILQLGECYYYGIGTVVDHQKAIELYTISASQGYVSAIVRLLKIYQNDKKNYDYWIQKSEELGIEKVQLEV